MGITKLIFDIRGIICNEKSYAESSYSPIPEYFIFLCKLVLYIEIMQKAIITIIKYTLKRQMNHIDVIADCLKNNNVIIVLGMQLFAIHKLAVLVYTEKCVVTSKPYTT